MLSIPSAGVKVRLPGLPSPLPAAVMQVGVEATPLQQFLASYDALGRREREVGLDVLLRRQARERAAG